MVKKDVSLANYFPFPEATSTPFHTDFIEEMALSFR